MRDVNLRTCVVEWLDERGSARKWQLGDVCVPFGFSGNMVIFEGRDPVDCGSKEELLLTLASKGMPMALAPAFEEAKYRAWYLFDEKGDLL